MNRTENQISGLDYSMYKSNSIGINENSENIELHNRTLNYFELNEERRHIREQKISGKSLTDEEERKPNKLNGEIKKAEWNVARVLFKMQDLITGYVEILNSLGMYNTNAESVFKSQYLSGLFVCTQKGLILTPNSDVFRKFAQSCVDYGLDMSSELDQSKIAALMFANYLSSSSVESFNSDIFIFLYPMNTSNVSMQIKDVLVEVLYAFLKPENPVTQESFKNEISEVISKLNINQDNRETLNIACEKFFSVFRLIFFQEKLDYTRNTIPQGLQGNNFFAISEAGGVENNVNRDSIGWSYEKDGIKDDTSAPFRFKDQFADVKNFSLFDYFSTTISEDKKGSEQNELIEDMNGFMGMTYNVCWFDGQWLKSEMPPDETTINFYKSIYKTPELLRGMVRYYLNGENEKYKDACKVFRSEAFQDYVLGLGNPDENRWKINDLLYAFVLTPQIFEKISFKNNLLNENKISVDKAIEEVKKSPYYKNFKYITDKMCKDKYYGEKKHEKYIVLDNAVGLFSGLDLTVKSNKTKNRIAIGIGSILLSIDGTLSVGIFVKDWFAGNWMSKITDYFVFVVKKLSGKVIDPKIVVGVLTSVAVVIAIVSLISVIRNAVNIKKDDGKGELFSNLNKKKFSKLNTDNLKNSGMKDVRLR